MKTLRTMIIHFLGGKTNEEFIRKQDEEVLELKRRNEWLAKKNLQLDWFFLAFTDVLDNFNRDSSDNNFSDLSSQRIREVARTYRMLSIYNSHAQFIKIEDDLCENLRDFILQDLHEVFCKGNFSDESFQKFESLKTRILPLIER